MTANADVRSLEHLELFLQQSQHFKGKLAKEIEALRVEIRRLTNWIEVDATGYWKEQLTKSQRHLVECQDALTRCMSYVREEEKRPCTEIKKRLQKAQQRRALCEEKLRTAKGAAQAWDRQTTKGNAKVHRCRDLGETDMTVAINVLKSQIATLEKYATLKSAATGTPNEVKVDSSEAGKTATGSVSNTDKAVADENQGAAQ